MHTHTQFFRKQFQETRHIPTASRRFKIATIPNLARTFTYRVPMIPSNFLKYQVPDKLAKCIKFHKSYLTAFMMFLTVKDKYIMLAEIIDLNKYSISLRVLFHPYYVTVPV